MSFSQYVQYGVQKFLKELRRSYNDWKILCQVWLLGFGVTALLKRVFLES